jgi:hypothetical protein
MEEGSVHGKSQNRLTFFSLQLQKKIQKNRIFGIKLFFIKMFALVINHRKFHQKF